MPFVKMSDEYRITGLSEIENGQKPKEKSGRIRWWLFVPLILLAIGLVSGGVYYLILEKEKKAGISKLFEFSGETPREQKISPKDIPNDPELQKAIRQFKDGYLRSAKANFYDLLQGTKSDQIKSFAAVYLGIISDEEGKYSLAVDFFNRAIKFDEQNFDAYYNLGIALKHSGNHAEAIRVLEKAAKLRPETSAAQILKGKLYYEANQLDEAEDTLKEVTDQGKNPSAIYNLGKVYKKQGKLTEAKAAFLNALELAGSGEVAYQSANELGILYATQGGLELPNAREYFQRAAKLAPDHPKYYYNLALVEYRLGEREAAIRALDQANRYEGGDSNTLLYMARLYEELGQTEKAEAALRKGLDESPGNIELLSSLADNLIGQNKWDTATRVLNDILNKSTKVLEKSQALYNLGIIKSELKDWDQAIDHLKRSQSLDPTNDDITAALGRVYVRSDEPHKAVSAFKEALRLNPYNTKILEEAAKVYLDLGLLSQAEESLHRLLENPRGSNDKKQLSFAYYNLGRLYKKRKDFDTAIDYFKEILQLQTGRDQYDALLETSDSILLAGKPPALTYPYLQKSIALKPREMEPRFLLSKALIQEDTIGSRSKAQDELLTIIQNEGTGLILLSKAHTLRGIIYYKEGLYLKALDDFNRALEIDPSNDEAFQNKRTTASKLEESN